jgi:hypothetical protein
MSKGENNWNIKSLNKKKEFIENFGNDFIVSTPIISLENERLQTFLESVMFGRFGIPFLGQSTLNGSQKLAIVGGRVEDGQL